MKKKFTSTEYNLLGRNSLNVMFKLNVVEYIKNIHPHLRVYEELDKIIVVGVVDLAEMKSILPLIIKGVFIQTYNEMNRTLTISYIGDSKLELIAWQTLSEAVDIFKEGDKVVEHLMANTSVSTFSKEVCTSK